MGTVGETPMLWCSDAEFDYQYTQLKISRYSNDPSTLLDYKSTNSLEHYVRLLSNPH
jgi:hypothetical protein